MNIPTARCGCKSGWTNIAHPAGKSGARRTKETRSPKPFQGTSAGV
jgi:hypothetical protein